MFTKTKYYAALLSLIGFTALYVVGLQMQRHENAVVTKRCTGIYTVYNIYTALGTAKKCVSRVQLDGPTVSLKD